MQVSGRIQLFQNISTYILISDVANDVFVIARVADEAAFDEGDVQNGSVEIDELEKSDYWLSYIFYRILITFYIMKEE